jgi:hypothetical protein
VCSAARHIKGNINFDWVAVGGRSAPIPFMSALGHEQTSRHVRVMSVIAPKTDIHQRGLHVRLVP